MPVSKKRVKNSQATQSKKLSSQTVGDKGNECYGKFSYYNNGVKGYEPPLPTSVVKEDDKRPNLIMLYFSEPDYTGHLYGTEGTEIKVSIEEMDDLLGYIMDELKSLSIYDNLNIIIEKLDGVIQSK